MSQQLINLSPDLKRLADEGYAIRIEAGLLVVEEIPYLDAVGTVKRGSFVCPLDESGEQTAPPSDHIISFTGTFPHDRYQQPIPSLGNHGPKHHTPSLKACSGFSNKPSGPKGPRPYRDFYEKVTTYEQIIVNEVR